MSFLGLPEEAVLVRYRGATGTFGCSSAQEAHHDPRGARMRAKPCMRSDLSPSLIPVLFTILNDENKWLQ